VATGIVQEFQFGMNWSEYSRFVGDVFGAPLAIEGLAAFFLESTFLGLWVFGRGRLSPRLHLLSIQLVAVGTLLSAYFILAANSWMQHPVGYRYNPVTGRAALTGAAVVLGISAWHLRRADDAYRDMHRSVLRVAAVAVLTCGLLTSVVGHLQAQIMTSQQPMKMAAAEALWHTTDHAPFSLFAYGDVSRGENKIDVSVPDGLSVLAGNSPATRVEGVVDVQADSAARYGPGSYVPVVWLAYWSFRLMIGFGVLSSLVALVVLVQSRRRRLEASPRLLRLVGWATLLPFAANSAGWIFTETARQPWLVYGVLRTRDGVSVGPGSGHVLATLVGFTLLYAGLGLVAVRLFLRIGREGPAGSDDPTSDPWLRPGHDDDDPARPAEPALVD